VSTDEFDFSDINIHGEKQPTHLYDDHELEQIEAWKNQCIHGTTRIENTAATLVGQVGLPNLTDCLEWVTELTLELGNEEFDSWLASGPHRNRQLELSAIHLMGAVLDHPDEICVDRHDYYATWLPDVGITVISVYSADPRDILHHTLAIGYIEGPYIYPQSSNILAILCQFWCGYSNDMSRWEFIYSNEGSACGRSCFLNKQLVSKYILMTTNA
jgi:hypothetical protein